MPKWQNEREAHMSEKDYEKEKQVRFLVDIRFQRNDSWQGKIKWLDANREQEFRSVLEMIKLMDEAITETEESHQNYWEQSD